MADVDTTARPLSVHEWMGLNGCEAWVQFGEENGEEVVIKQDDPLIRYFPGGSIVADSEGLGVFLDEDETELPSGKECHWYVAMKIPTQALAYKILDAMPNQWPEEELIRLGFQTV